MLLYSKKLKGEEVLVPDILLDLDDKDGTWDWIIRKYAD